ncbi:MAG: glycosyltransferase family 9 protein [Chloroherpetonaceae bacterium]|nr:glycosyltransferase family 9 protein [Chloroherpetonaceae bacterium]
MSKKVLIVKILGIGDVVMSLSIIDWIQKYEPETQVTWVIGKSSAELLTPFKEIITPIIVDEKKLFGTSFFSKGTELFKVWKSLFLKKFELILTLHSDSRFRLISLFTTAKETRFFKRKGRVLPNPSRHYSNEYLNLYLNLDSFENQSAALPQLQRREEASQVKQFFSEKSAYVCLSVGGAKNALSEAPLKRWPIEHYLTLATKLSEFGIKVVLIGAPSDLADAKHFAHLPNVINLVGKTTLLECVEVISYSNALVSHDTGNLHLGSLTSTPIIALFGPTNPCNFSPVRSDVITLWGGDNLPCRPCYDGRTFAKCTNNECMKSILPDDVLNQLNHILSQRINDHTY